MSHDVCVAVVLFCVSWKYCGLTQAHHSLLCINCYIIIFGFPWRPFPLLADCKSLNFWGFLGIDVLFNTAGRGYLVDINPRVTGSSPALITLHLLKKAYGFMCGLFRRTGDINFYGTSQQLLDRAHAYNVEHEGSSRVVIHSFYEAIPGKQIRMNIGVYGTDMDECKTVLNEFAVPKAHPNHHDD